MDRKMKMVMKNIVGKVKPTQNYNNVITNSLENYNLFFPGAQVLLINHVNYCIYEVTLTSMMTKLGQS